MPRYAPQVPVTTREVAAPVWRVLCAAERPASVQELHVSTGSDPNRVQAQLALWRRVGLVQSSGDHPRRYALTDRADRRGPVPVIRGRAVAVSRAPTSRQQIWSAMRVLKRFDVPTLMMTAQASRRSVEDFVNVLQRAGYLRRDRRGNSVRGEWSIYVLRGATGPKAPSVRQVMVDGCRRRILTDPNDASRHDVSPDAVSLRRGTKHV